MLHKIENEYLTCEIDDMGAQLHSLVSKENGKEYIWYGRTEIWYGQAPVLFPIIGQLIDDTYYYNGVKYTMPKHGLASKLPFKVKGDLEAARRTHQHIILLDNAIDANFNASAKYLVKLQGVNINWYTRGSHNLSDARIRSIEVFHDWAVSEGLLK